MRLSWSQGGGPAVALVALALATGCEPTTPVTAGPADAGASPNAKIYPAPLVTESPELADGSVVLLEDADTRRGQGDGLNDASAPPTESMRPGAPLEAESLSAQRELTGVTVEAVIRWRDVPLPPKAAEVSLDGIREAQRIASLSIKADLGEIGRMRLEFVGAAFPFPPHTEIRARSDRYGNLIFWPSLTDYRVVPPGALRTTLGELRVDVTPLSTPTIRLQGEGKRLGLITRKLELGSSLGTVKLEQSRLPEAGEGAALLCRLLVELMGIEPRSQACQPSEVPLYASYSWQDGGGFTFEVTALAKRTELPTHLLLVPPPSTTCAASGLPTIPDGLHLSQQTLATLRTGTAPPLAAKDPGSPADGILAVNRSDRMMYLLVDGVPVVSLSPHTERQVRGVVRGRYQTQWRTLLGEKVAPAEMTEVPSRIVYGIGPDSGAPDGG